MKRVLTCCAAIGAISAAMVAAADPPRTSLDNPAVKFTPVKGHYVILKRGDLEAVIVDNAAVDDEVLPQHRAGYSGVASLTHARRSDNLFVPGIAGLNFEHILDGTTQPREILFEPRHAPMHLRRIDEHTVELHQPPTPHYGVESCLRYTLLPDGAIELCIECIPRRKTFRHGYLCIFFASYINQPESLDIHFLGHEDGRPPAAEWVRGVTPKHGVLSTHRATDDDRDPPHDEPFPLTLVYNYSRHRYRQPWYFGVRRGMALVQIFRPQDRVRLTQSPSGGGAGNPAWDFQYLLEDCQVGKRYQMVMRAVYLPYESPEQVRRATADHRRALGIEE